MIVVCVVIWVILFVFFLVTRNYKKERFAKLDRKEHSLIVLYPTSYFLYHKLRFVKLAQKEEKARVAWRVLAVKGEASLRFEQYVIQKLSRSFLIIFCTVTLAILLEVLTTVNPTDPKIILRPEKGRESLELHYALEEGKQDSLTVEVVPTISLEKEAIEESGEDLCQIAYDAINEVILGQNSGFSYIVYPLFLVEELPEYGLSIQWECSPKEVISSKGEVYNEDLTESVLVKVTGSIYQKQLNEVGTYQVTVTVIPKKQYEYDCWREELAESIESITKESSEEEAIKLPEEFLGKRILWLSKSGKQAMGILVLGILVGILLYYSANEQLTKEVKNRKKQMVLDYPDIVNKLALLIGAGMTVSGAWNRIVTDYTNLLDSKKPQLRVAYEEMKATNYEMKLGVSEAVALEEFGRRLGIVEYMKLSSVLIQNLRKGSDGLMQLLSLMSQDAFEQRKQRAKQLGEEAGTKLLLPMMIMLVLVFVIILVPAFWSMQI